MNPPFLRFSVGWAATHTLIFLGLGCVLGWVVWTAPPSQSVRYRWLEDLNAASGGWLFLIGYGALAAFCVYRGMISLWRFSTNAPAVVVVASHLKLHPSFLLQTRSISFVEIREIRLLRGDKYRGSGLAGWGVRQGQKCRSFLSIKYAIGGRNRTLQLFDNVVEGGHDKLITMFIHLRRSRRGVSQLRRPT